MTDPDLIIFDCDGVLVDSEVLSCRCLSEVLAGYGISLGLDQALDLFLGRSMSAVLDHYKTIGCLDPEQFSAELRAGVRAAFLASLCPIEGVQSVLEGLRIPHCVASSSDVDRVSFSLSLTGLAPHFDTRLYTSQMVARGKPAPDLFLYAAERMQVDPHRTLVIEDSISGVKAGKAAGMTVWGFVGGSHYQSRDGKGILREAGADRVFGRMADFWRTDGKSMRAASHNEKSRLDEAARAGWLYFIAGHTQDEIAKTLQVSRASAQRLVSLCLAERLITFRLEHPIAACMELAARLKDLFYLVYCEVVPTDPAASLSAAGIAERAANILESMLRTGKPTILALGTGRAVRAAVERVSPIDCPNHQIVSLVGNISADGSASFFDTVGRLADRTKARHYPMPLPFLMSSERERDQMLRIDPIARVRAVAAKADLRLVGIGQMDQGAQVFVDGFVSREELLEIMRLGAVGELTGWAFDAQGRIVEGGTTRRLTSIPPQVPAKAMTIGAAVGPAKVSAIRAALKGRLINGLITDEATASAILKQ